LALTGFSRYNPQVSLRIQLLGPFRVWRDEAEITAAVHKIGKADLLLKHVLSHPGETFTPDQLVEALWGQELDEGKTTVEKAKANLHRRLSELRKLLEPSLAKSAESVYLLSTPKGYCFNLKSDCHLDAHEFVERCEQAQIQYQQNEYAPAILAYESALPLVQGDYLSEDRYAEWAIQLREKWQAAYVDALANLAECHARLGQYRRAIARCHQALRLQTHRESLYRQLMLYCYLSGDQAEALQIYEQCRETLDKQLDVDPAPETQELYRQILNRHIPGIDQIYKPLAIERHPIPYSLGRTPFVGRSKEYALLSNHLREACSGQGRVLLISGEAGIGKSRLVQELLAYARETQGTVLQGRCSDLAVKLAFEPIIQALRYSLTQIQTRLKEELAPLWLAEMTKLVPEFLTLTELPVNPALSPEQERHRLFEALTQSLICLGQERPLVLVLDDVHWADSATLDFLPYMAPRIAGQSITLIATYRSEETPKPPLASVRDETGRELVHSVSLTRLSLKETQELLQQMGRMPKTVAERLSQRLQQETEGNPFFLVAVLQALFEEGAMRVHENGAWVTDIDEITTNYRELLIPTKVKEIIQRRLERLNKSEQELLTLAAVAGRRFEYRLLEKAWNQTATLEVIENLSKAQLLVAENGHYEFHHEKVREVIYAETSAPRRQQLHRQIAETIEHLHHHRLEEHFSALAYHFAQGQEFMKAFEYTYRALKQAVARYQNEEGLKLTELGLKLSRELPDDPTLEERRLELLAERVALFDLLGRRAEQAETIDQVFQWAKTTQNRTFECEAHRLRTKLWLALGRYTDAQAEIEKALEISKNLGNKSLQAKALQSLGTVRWYLGAHAQALDCYTQVATLSDFIGDKKEHLHAVHNIGTVHHYLGRYIEALRCYREAGELARAIGNKVVEAQAWQNIAALQDAQGDHPAVLQTYDRAYELFRQIGDIRGQASTLNNLGILYLNRQRYDKALKHYETAHELFRNIQEKNGISQVLLGLGQIYHDLDQDHQALEYFEKAHEICQELGSRILEAFSLYSLGEAHHGLGHHAEALRYYGEAQAMQAQIGDKLRECFTLRDLGKLYLDMNAPMKARDALVRARQQAVELGLKSEESQCLVYLSMAYLQEGETASALDFSRQATGLLEQAMPTKCAPLVYFSHYRTLIASGQASASRLFLQRAYDEIMHAAAAIEEPKIRELFLRAKPAAEVLVTWAEIHRQGSKHP
jgi:predicted ATPase/DNA-binding SARP family transcriptional activator